MTACVVVSHVLLIWREHLSACQRGGSLMLFIGNHKSSSYSIPAHLWYSTCPTASRFVRHKAVCIQTQWTYCIFLHLWSQHVTVTATSASMWHVAVHCELKSPTPHTLQIHSCHCVTKTSFRPFAAYYLISQTHLSEHQTGHSQLFLIINCHIFMFLFDCILFKGLICKRGWFYSLNTNSSKADIWDGGWPDLKCQSVSIDEDCLKALSSTLVVFNVLLN